MTKRKALINRSKLNFFLDIGIALAFAAEMEEHMTGLRIHELLGLAVGIVLLLHIILHWNWVVSVTKRFFQMIFHSSRLNYVLNVALFLDMVTAVVSGILISRTLGLDLTAVGSQFNWRSIHVISSDMSLLIVALHVALHWKWIATHGQKYLLNFKALGKKLRIAQVTPNPRNFTTS